MSIISEEQAWVVKLTISNLQRKSNKDRADARKKAKEMLVDVWQGKVKEMERRRDLI